MKITSSVGYYVNLSAFSPSETFWKMIYRKAEISTSYENCIKPGYYLTFK